MGFGLRKCIRKFNVKKNIFMFSIIKLLFGYDVLNLFIQRVSKDSIIPILRRNKAQIGYNCDIECGLIFHKLKDYSNLRIGNNCYIGTNSFFDLSDKIIIGDNVVISPKCTFITHISLEQSPLKRKYLSQKAPIEIKNGCYIGVNSTILMGVTIGENSFIAAGSVVTKDVEPFTMVGGVPARFIKKLEIENEKS